MIDLFLQHLLEFGILTIVGLAFKVIAARLKPGAVRDALEEGVLAAEVVVRNLEQTVRPELAKALEDGSLSQEEASELKEMAMEAMHETVSPQAKKLLASNAERLDIYFSQLIESQVHAQK